jgi:hypothetical protein
MFIIQVMITVLLVWSVIGTDAIHLTVNRLPTMKNLMLSTVILS